MKSNKKIVIVRRKKAHGHGSHGGSWKVAYADFVTAMMAFFMVMWLLGMDESLREAVEGYFTNPIGFKKGYSGGASPLSSGASPMTIQAPALQLVLPTRRTAPEARTGSNEFSELRSKVEERLAGSALLGKGAGRVEVTMTEEGLRIELIEGVAGETFFAVGSAAITPVGLLALQLIGEELRGLSHPIVLEGHTDAKQYGGRHYTNWELSADRANTARRVLEESGITRSRILEIRGLADRQLRIPDQPFDPANRRIALLLPFPSAPMSVLDSLAVFPKGVTPVTRQR